MLSTIEFSTFSEHYVSLSLSSGSIRVCSVRRVVQGHREWASVPLAFIARQEFALLARWERTAPAKGTGIRCHAPLGNSTRWLVRRGVRRARAGSFAPVLVVLIPHHVRRGWCAAGLCLPRLINDPLPVSRTTAGKNGILVDVLEFANFVP